jgi:Uma2 family endonuclease
MGAAGQIPRISFEEFLALEPMNACKHEWLNGIVYMMACGTFEHGRLVDDVLVTLRQALTEQPCRPYAGNFLVRTPSGLGAYPDVMVFCQKIEGRPTDPKRAATNPTVIIEVLSESTEEYDRGEKFENYKSIPSLEDYVIVRQSEPGIEVYSRSTGWQRHEATLGEAIEIPSLAVSLSVDAVWVR